MSFEVAASDFEVEVNVALDVILSDKIAKNPVIFQLHRKHRS